MKAFQVVKKDSNYIVSFGSVSIECKAADEIGQTITWLETFPSAPAAPRPGRTRKQVILECLKAQKKPMTVTEIMSIVGASQDESRNFASTCLGLVESKELKRKRNDERVFTYEIR